jgi:hypothetical protein
MTDLRKMIEDACRQDDAARKEFELWEWQRVQRAKRSTPAEIVYKTYERRPAPQTTTMSAEAQKQWDRYVDGRVLKMFSKGGVLHDALAETISRLRTAERQHMRERVADEIKNLRTDINVEKLREEIAGLRIDNVVNRSVLRGEINSLMKTKAKART